MSRRDPLSITAVLALSALGGCVPHLPELVQQGVDFEGRTQTYRLFVPESLPARPVPLVVALHRYTENGTAMAWMTGFNELAEREGFIVVYPDGPGRRFDAFDGGRDDVGFILETIENVAADHDIDRARIYLTGASNGGFMAFVLACREPYAFAAVAPVMALMPAKLSRDPPAAHTPPVPMLIINGTDDGIIKWNATEIYAGKPVEVLPVGQGVAYWVRRNGCRETPVVERLDDVDPKDGTRVTRLRYEGGQAPVVLYRIEGGGHTWPGGNEPAPGFIVGRTSRDFAATEAIWEFFATQPSQLSDRRGVPDRLELDERLDPPG